MEQRFQTSPTISISALGESEIFFFFSPSVALENEQTQISCPGHSDCRHAEAGFPLLRVSDRECYSSCDVEECGVVKKLKYLVNPIFKFVYQWCELMI